MTICILTSVDPEHPQLDATENLEVMPLDEGHLDHTVQICLEMAKETRHTLVGLLQKYKDVSTFNPKEMPDINPVVMEHRRNVDPSHRPMAKKKRYIGPERSVLQQRKYKSYWMRALSGNASAPNGFPTWYLSRNPMGPTRCVSILLI